MYFAYYEAFTLHITKNFCCPWRIRTSTAWTKTTCPAIRPKDNLICTDGEIRTPIDGFGDRHATIAPHPCVFCGATGDRTRVLWVQVRNFSQLNYGPILSGKQDSNLRAPASKAGEDDLTPPFPVLSKWQGSNLRSPAPKARGIPTFPHLVISMNSFVVRGGIEPPTPGFSVLCSTYWATAPYAKKKSDSFWESDFLYV